MNGFFVLAVDQALVSLINFDSSDLRVGRENSAVQGFWASSASTFVTDLVGRIRLLHEHDPVAHGEIWRFAALVSDDHVLVIIDAKRDVWRRKKPCSGFSAWVQRAQDLAHRLFKKLAQAVELFFLEVGFPVLNEHASLLWLEVALTSSLLLVDFFPCHRN